jgi:hypothetical protein
MAKDSVYSMTPDAIGQLCLLCGGVAGISASFASDRIEFLGIDYPYFFSVCLSCLSKANFCDRVSDSIKRNQVVH